MSVSGDDVKLSLKVAINPQNAVVVFAEMESDLADVLLSFLTLPLGRIVRLFQNYNGRNDDRAAAVPLLPSLNNLYKSLADLEDVHFWTKEGKQMLLHPRSLFSFRSSVRKKLSIDDSPTYACENFILNGGSCFKISMFADARCDCGKLTSKKLRLWMPADSIRTLKSRNFSISDDLRIVSNASGSLLENVDRLRISDMDGFIERIVPIGRGDAMELLKGLFSSQTLLTDFVLRMKRSSYKSINENYPKTAASSSSKKFVIKAVLQKSTNKLLFAHAKDDFVDFLFSLMSIRLGTAAHVLGGKTSFTCIDNLYQSVFDLDKDNLLMRSEEKAFLLKLPKIYFSKTNILPLVQTSTQKFNEKQQLNRRYFWLDDVDFIDPKGCKGSYIRAPAMFLVTDDLTVVPFTMFSAAYRLKNMNVSITDVEEVDREIGVQEALRILKASLTSVAVLSHALML